MLRLVVSHGRDVDKPLKSLPHFLRVVEKVGRYGQVQGGSVVAVRLQALLERGECVDEIARLHKRDPDVVEHLRPKCALMQALEIATNLVRC